MTTGRKKKRVLIVFANPRGSDALRLGQEERAIKESVRLSKYRHIDVTTCQAATVHDLRRALLDDEYDIVHFSGHGTRTGLVLEQEDGSRYVVPQSALADTLAAYAAPQGRIECVLLNACYSVSTGTLTSLGVPFTIAMDGPISDNAAIEFSRGFYDALGARKGIEFAYEEGCRTVALAAPGSSFVPSLLHPGETAEEISEPDTPTSPSRGASEIDVPPLLVGLALDVSYSMTGSIRNETGMDTSRLEGFRASLHKALNDASDGVKRRTDHPEIDLFAYAFGLRHRNVGFVDLLSLVSLGKDIVSQDEIERLKEKHTRAVRSKYEQYGGAADLVRSLGLDRYVDGIAEGMRAKAEGEVRERVQTEVADRIAARLADIGDTTLSIVELAELWDTSKSAFDDAEPLIYGATPMTAALRAVENRYQRELKKRQHNKPNATLFLLSDGEPTDGSPIEHIRAIHDQGVTVISCFVTNADIADPRTLYGEPQEGWSAEAQLMFEAASVLSDDSELMQFLLRKGWRVHSESRLFVQLNHTAVLNEFVEMMLLPVQGKTPDWQLPKGEEPTNP